jgi:hypothetical protein
VLKGVEMFTKLTKDIRTGVDSLAKLILGEVGSNLWRRLPQAGNASSRREVMAAYRALPSGEPNRPYGARELSK